MRLFIAVNFDKSFISSLGDIQNQLRSQCQSVSLTSKDSLHLTLAFLGETPSAKYPTDAISCIKSASFPISMSGYGHFGDLYWVGIDRCENLFRLAAEVRHSLDSYGCDFDRKPFVPHITIARKVVLNSGVDKVMLDVPSSSTCVNSVSLMLSERTGGGVRYRELYKAIL